MVKNVEYYLGLIYRLVDLAAINLSFFLGVLFRFYEDQTFSFSQNNYIQLLLFINLTWVIISSSQRIYDQKRFSSKNRYILAMVVIILLQFLITIGFNGLIKTFYSRIFILYTYVSFAIIISIGRYAASVLFALYLNKRAIKTTVVVVGNDLFQKEVISFLKNEINSDYEEIKQLNEPDRILNMLHNQDEGDKVSEVYAPISQYNDEELDQLITFCDNNFIRLRLIFDRYKISARNMTVNKYNQTTVFKINLTPLDEAYNAMLKRTFDLAFTITLFITCFIWLFPIIAIAIKLSSKGPVFFKQKRTGAGNKEFLCFKFRSMKQNEEADSKQAVKNDPRVTKIGEFLRRSSLDELPQFINVLKGEMSIVGPRPHMLKHTEEFAALIGNFMNRHAIKPGITGLAQVKGYRGEIDDLSLLQNRVRLDRFYVNNWSLILDIKIVLRTVLTVFEDHR